MKTNRIKELEADTQAMFLRLARANKRDTGMHLSAEEVAILYWHFSSEISTALVTAGKLPASPA